MAAHRDGSPYRCFAHKEHGWTANDRKFLCYASVCESGVSVMKDLSALVFAQSSQRPRSFLSLRSVSASLAPSARYGLEPQMDCPPVNSRSSLPIASGMMCSGFVNGPSPLQNRHLFLLVLLTPATTGARVLAFGTLSC